MGFDLRGDPAVDAADPAQPAVDERRVALRTRFPQLIYLPQKSSPICGK